MLPRSKMSQSKQPRDHTAREGGSTVGALSGTLLASTRAQGPLHGRRTGGRAQAGSHARAHAHAHRRARRGSTLSRRRARVRGKAVCRRTGRSGPPWWTRAYMSNARLRVWPAVVGSWPKRLKGGSWPELPEAPGEPAGRSAWLQKRDQHADRARRQQRLEEAASWLTRSRRARTPARCRPCRPTLAAYERAAPSRSRALRKAGHAGRSQGRQCLFRGAPY